MQLFKSSGQFPTNRRIQSNRTKAGKNFLRCRVKKTRCTELTRLYLQTALLKTGEIIKNGRTFTSRQASICPGNSQKMRCAVLVNLLSILSSNSALQKESYVLLIFLFLPLGGSSCQDLDKQMTGTTIIGTAAITTRIWEINFSIRRKRPVWRRLAAWIVSRAMEKQ